MACEKCVVYSSPIGCTSRSLLGPEDSSFRAFSRRHKFTARCLKLNKRHLFSRRAEEEEGAEKADPEEDPEDKFRRKRAAKAPIIATGRGVDKKLDRPAAPLSKKEMRELAAIEAESAAEETLNHEP